MTKIRNIGLLYFKNFYFLFFLSVRRSNYVGDFFPEDDDVLVLNSNVDVEVLGQSNSNNRRSQSNHQSPVSMEIPNNNASPLVVFVLNL